MLQQFYIHNLQIEEKIFTPYLGGQARTYPFTLIQAHIHSAPELYISGFGEFEGPEFCCKEIPVNGIEIFK